MQCDRAQEQLFDYIEDALTPAMRQVLEHHISACASCKKELSELRSVYILLDEGLPEVPVPLGFRASVLTAVSELPKPLSLAGRIQQIFLPQGSNSRVPVFGFAAAAMLVVVAFSSVALNKHINTNTNSPTPMIMRGNIVPLPNPQLPVQNDGIVQSVRSYQQGAQVYHVFGMHLGSKSDPTTVNNYVVQSDDVLSNPTLLADPTVTTTASALSLTPGSSYDLPIAVPSDLPADKSMTLLSEWSDSAGLHQEVCFVPLSTQAASTPVAVTKGESLYDALATVAAATNTSIIVSDKASDDLTQPISRGLDMSDTTVNDALADLALPAHHTFTRQNDGSYVIR